MFYRWVNSDLQSRYDIDVIQV